MKNFIRWTTDHPVFSNVLMIGLLVAGFNAAFQLKRELLPPFARDQIKIEVIYSNAQPQEIEESICLKIEEALDGLADVYQMDSKAESEKGEVLLYLHSGADIRTVVDEVKTRVEKIEFPENSEEPQINQLFNQNRLIQTLLYLNGEFSNTEKEKRKLKEVADDINDGLLDLPNVKHIEWSGLPKYEIAIEISREALQKYDLSFAQVLTTIKRSNLNLAGGTLYTKSGEIKIYSQNKRQSGEQFRNLLLIARSDGTKIYLKDVASVVDGFEEGKSYGRFNGKPAALLVVYSSKFQDAITTSAAIKEYLDKKRKTLPEDMELILWSDLSEFIRERLQKLGSTALVSFVLVVLSLWLFLSLRLSFWVAAGIPVSFAGGFLVLWIFGQSLNMLTMFALMIGVGMIVDDAIVIGENVYSHKNRQNADPLAVINGTSEMSWPVLASTATTIAAFAPMLFVSGILGKFMREIPIVVIAVLITSLIESFFVLPHHLRHSSEKKEGFGFFQPLRRCVDFLIKTLIPGIFNTLYSFGLRYPIIIVAITFATTIYSWGLIQGGVVRYVTFPKLDNDIIEARVTFPSGTHTEKVHDAVVYLENTIKELDLELTNGKDPVVKRIYSQVGSRNKEEEAIVIVELAKAGKREYHSDEILRRWGQKVGEIPETVTSTFATRQQSLEGKPLNIKLLSKDFEQLKIASAKFRQQLAQYQGLLNIEDDYQLGKLEIRPVLKDQGRLLGLSEEDVATQLFSGFAGKEALKIRRGQEELKVVVRYAYSQRNSIASLSSVKIQTANGDRIPLRFVADFSNYQGPAVIKRENRWRRIIVSSSIDETKITLGQIKQECRQHLFPQIKNEYPEVSISFAGQEEANNRSVDDLIVGFQYGLITIFMILALVFRSYIQPILIMIVIPLSFAGAIYGHWLMNLNLSGMSMFGMAALAGVVVNNSLVLIDHINREIGNGASVNQALIGAGPARFRAIILTTMTTFIGLTPIMFSNDLQAMFMVPMAVSLGFGLLFSTFIVLFLIPVLFLYLNTLRRFFYWIKKGKWPTKEQVEPAFDQRFLHLE